MSSSTCQMLPSGFTVPVGHSPRTRYIGSNGTSIVNSCASASYIASNDPLIANDHSRTRYIGSNGTSIASGYTSTEYVRSNGSNDGCKRLRVIPVHNRQLISNEQPVGQVRNLSSKDQSVNNLRVVIKSIEDSASQNENSVYRVIPFNNKQLVTSAPPDLQTGHSELNPRHFHGGQLMSSGHSTVKAQLLNSEQLKTNENSPMQNSNVFLRVNPLNDRQLISSERSTVQNEHSKLNAQPQNSGQHKLRERSTLPNEVSAFDSLLVSCRNIVTKNDSSASHIQTDKAGSATSARKADATELIKEDKKIDWGTLTKYGLLYKEPALLEELEQYLPKPIHMWREKDCESWLASVCKQQNLDRSKVMELSSAIQLTGLDLLRWRLRDFALYFGPSNGFEIFAELGKKEKELALLNAQEGTMIQKFERKRRDDQDDINDASLITKGQQLTVWEFLSVILAIPSQNPLAIRWEREAQGMFRLTNPVEIIRLWGKRTIIPQNITLKVNDERLHDSLKKKLTGRGYLLYQHFLGHLSREIEAGHLFKIDQKQLIYQLGDEARTLYTDLTRGAMA